MEPDMDSEGETAAAPAAAPATKGLSSSLFALSIEVNERPCANGGGGEGPEVATGGTERLAEGIGARIDGIEG